MNPAETTAGAQDQSGPQDILQPNSIWNKCFRIEELLGMGGAACVYKAEHLSLNCMVALKIMHSTDTDDVSVARFLREARVISSLTHHNVVMLRQFGQAEQRLFMALEFVEGMTLAQLLKQVGTLPAERSVGIIRQVCAGIQAAHDAGIIHRDLKPSNILICADHEKSDFVKIIDFGIARSQLSNGDATLTQTRVVVGTPNYISPEQCSDGVIDQRCDIYSIGCILYELLCGQPPFVDENVLMVLSRHIHEEVATVPCLEPIPHTLRDIVVRCLAKDPSKRFSCCRELASVLANIDWNTQRIVTGKLGRPEKRSRVLQVGICCAVLLTLCGILFYTNNRNRDLSYLYSPPKKSEDIIPKKLISAESAAKRWKSPFEKIQYYELWIRRHSGKDLEDDAKAHFVLGELYKEAADYQHNQHYEIAGRLYDKLLKQLAATSPEPTESLINAIRSRARCYSRLGAENLAINLLEAELSNIEKRKEGINPIFVADIRVDLGMMYLKLGRIADALRQADLVEQATDGVDMQLKQTLLRVRASILGNDISRAKEVIDRFETSINQGNKENDPKTMLEFFYNNIASIGSEYGQSGIALAAIERLEKLRAHDPELNSRSSMLMRKVTNLINQGSDARVLIEIERSLDSLNRADIDERLYPLSMLLFASGYFVVEKSTIQAAYRRTMNSMPECPPDHLHLIEMMSITSAQLFESGCESEAKALLSKAISLVDVNDSAMARQCLGLTEVAIELGMFHHAQLLSNKIMLAKISTTTCLRAMMLRAVALSYMGESNAAALQLKGSLAEKVHLNEQHTDVVENLIDQIIIQRNAKNRQLEAEAYKFAGALMNNVNMVRLLRCRLCKIYPSLIANGNEQLAKELLDWSINLPCSDKTDLDYTAYLIGGVYFRKHDYHKACELWYPLIAHHNQWKPWQQIHILQSIKCAAEQCNDLATASKITALIGKKID